MPAIKIKLFVVLSLIACASSGWAEDELVAVETTDGRVHHGVVDSRTDDRWLWLRQDESNVALAYSLAWSKVQRAAVGSDQMTADELRQWASENAHKRPALSVLLDEVELYEVEQRPGVAMKARRPPPARVTSLGLAAVAAQWDADPQSDGIELLVTPLDAQGFVAPARGELTVRLLGRRQETRHSERFVELQRWTEPVRLEHFAQPDCGAVYRLPYRGIDPDADWRIGYDAILHASLGVFGEGRFEASTPVSLRPEDPLRDQLQQGTGRRQFPIERRAGVALPAAPHSDARLSSPLLRSWPVRRSTSP